jgi:hypothetical protein
MSRRREMRSREVVERQSIAELARACLWAIAAFLKELCIALFELVDSAMERHRQQQQESEENEEESGPKVGETSEGDDRTHREKGKSDREEESLCCPSRLSHEIVSILVGV